MTCVYLLAIQPGRCQSNSNKTSGFSLHKAGRLLKKFVLVFSLDRAGPPVLPQIVYLYQQQYSYLNLHVHCGRFRSALQVLCNHEGGGVPGGGALPVPGQPRKDLCSSSFPNIRITKEKLRRTRLGEFFELDNSFICAGGVKVILRLANKLDTFNPVGNTPSWAKRRRYPKIAWTPAPLQHTPTPNLPPHNILYKFW